MKKIITFALAATLTIASSIIAFAAEPVGTITNVYTFEGDDRTGKNCDTYVNPFKNLGLDVASIQYTVTIPTDPAYLTGYDTVMTFGNSSSGGFVYICNELVGMNKSGFVDFWPSGTTAAMVYPGKGESYTVNLVFSNDGVAFYLNGEQQPGSNVPAPNGDGEYGDKTGADILNVLNTNDTLYIGDQNTSYWAAQNMILQDIVFFNGEVTSPYTITGEEAKVSHLSDTGEVETEKATEKKEADTADNEVDQPNVTKKKGVNTNLIIIIVVVVIVIVLGSAGFVIFSQKRR